MKDLILMPRLLCCLLLACAAVGCTAESPDELPSTCAQDSDCVTEGGVCATRPGTTERSCCLPHAEECNGVDEDCDGQVDEDFDLQTSAQHCGQCNHPCTLQEACVAGKCELRTETSCSNGADDNGNSLVDCEESSCNDQSCGAGCSCRNTRKAEFACGNANDDDGDGSRDCGDPDCDGASCGMGCTCTGLLPKEILCDDGLDNGGNAGADCDDLDCDTLACGAGCVCTGRARTETLCDDNVDNDGNHGADCADVADCEGAIIRQPAGQVPSAICIGGQSRETDCANSVDDNGDGRIDCKAGNADANCVSGSCGPGCTLMNCVRKETVCNDRIDNDGNNGTDCSDSADCPQGTACTRANGAPGTCQSNRTCG